MPGLSGSGGGKPLVLLWLNEADRYLRAAAEAGLTQSIDFAKVAAGQTPARELLSRAEGVLACSLPAGIIPAMPKLRWIQTMSAGAFTTEAVSCAEVPVSRLAGAPDMATLGAGACVPTVSDTVAVGGVVGNDGLFRSNAA